ncbi:2-succinylbenzoate--CoA ligase [Leptolyngbya sp. FACHB-671]|uniref:2-succinylbenzoate--CoA ligase n=1 Tax=Leptolyngbya sp. FACHB-671 TaxID=2692812 RepID=UPI0016848F2C|nr:2-succinylbenzoate--CoA ligase [Leptolyngbya sp. FACHB-671]MBD2071185.1 2-succinylbenzoate--CoA ligase [Leptolyngbya sp. FACHB-671]
MTPLTYLPHQTANDWLGGCDSEKFAELVTQFLAELHSLKASGNLPKLLLVEPDPIRFLARFIAACSANYPVFLSNPGWVKAEWEQVLSLVQPDLIWGEADRVTCSLPAFPDISLKNLTPSLTTESHHAQSGWIMIPTGGSSGKIRFAIHTWQTLMAAVQGFQQYFQTNQINSFCVLPLYHVSGLMQFLRSFTTGGKLVIVPFKAIEREMREIDPAEFFISLVPTQLQRLLHDSHSRDWLTQFHTVLLGGAPAWADLLQVARKHQIRLAPTYGMTETAAQIATLKPDQFLANQSHCGKVLPHARITIWDANLPLGANQLGQITVQADSLALGYYPEPGFGETFRLDDLGFLDEQGELHVVGRNNDKIITGGENVFPIEVEAAIRATKCVADVAVLGLNDRHWGQVITAVYIPKNSAISADSLRLALSDRLSKFKQPKYWIDVKSLPRNAQGKINREQLRQIAVDWLATRSTDPASE